MGATSDMSSNTLLLSPLRGRSESVTPEEVRVLQLRGTRSMSPPRYRVNVVSQLADLEPHTSSVQSVIDRVVAGEPGHGTNNMVMPTSVRPAEFSRRQRNSQMEAISDIVYNVTAAMSPYRRSGSSTVGVRERLDSLEKEVFWLRWGIVAVLMQSVISWWRH